MTVETINVGMKDTVERQASQSQEGVLLSIQNLRVWFELRRWGFGHAGYVKAVDNVSFDLHDGEAIAVVGESGCGKSSLMKTILGLYQPKEGNVIFAGKNLRQLGKDGCVGIDPR